MERMQLELCNAETYETYAMTYESEEILVLLEEVGHQECYN